MKIPTFLLVALAHIAVCLSATDTLRSTNTYLTQADRAHFKRIIEPAFELNDISSVYHAILGYQSLGQSLPKTQEICNYLTGTANIEENITVEKAFYIASAWKLVGNCKQPVPAAVKKILNGVLEKESSPISDFYYAVSGLSALSEKLTRDKVEKITKTIQIALRKDENLWNLGYTFHIASELESAGQFAFNHIEDAVIQADEVDGQYLQFEGGLSVTSFLINGIFKLSHTLKKKPPVTFQQTIKMANYLLSRRSTQTVKGAANLLSALTTLATNEFEKPICITLTEGGISISKEQPLFMIKVCDILGNPLPSIPKVVANAVTRIQDDALLLSKKDLQASSSDKTLFSLNLMEAKPERGFYQVSVAAGSIVNTVTVKVLCEVKPDYLEIGTGDADQTTQPKLTRVAYPQKLGQKIEADSQQKLVMRFLLKDATTMAAMRTHQAFVRLSSVAETTTGNRGNEIIFVAEPDSSHVYKFDMPVGSAAVNFGHQSGDYNVELIVGDSVLSNPFKWTVATVTLKFPESAALESAERHSSSKQRVNMYTTKPEITHMFREPEKRPPAFVSNMFSGLCLAPVLLLLAMWAKLGVNISNFPLSVSAVTFHLGLGSIFVLFGIFWLQLNMFVTLRYLLGLGVVTFLAGNKLLSRIAHKHKLSR